ncbi:MAG TPA: hypothetical protein VF753_22480 [Terriglobales bacterium]
MSKSWVRFHPQNFVGVLGYVAEFEVTTFLANAGEGADHGADAAGIDEGDFAEVENDGLAVAQEPGDVSAEGFGLVAADDAAGAADDGDAADVAGFERQTHGTLPAKSGINSSNRDIITLKAARVAGKLLIGRAFINIGHSGRGRNPAIWRNRTLYRP